MSNPKIVDFENRFSDLILEIFTEDDLNDLKEYFEDTTLIFMIKEALRYE